MPSATRGRWCSSPGINPAAVRAGINPGGAGRESIPAAVFDLFAGNQSRRIRVGRVIGLWRSLRRRQVVTVWVQPTNVPRRCRNERSWQLMTDSYRRRRRMPCIGTSAQPNRLSRCAPELLVTRPVSDRTLIIDRGSLSDPLGTIRPRTRNGTAAFLYRRSASPSTTDLTDDQLTQIGEAR